MPDKFVVFLDKVSACLDEGRPVDVIYLDFATAFDKVPHKRLLEKLQVMELEVKYFNGLRHGSQTDNSESVFRAFCQIGLR